MSTYRSCRKLSAKYPLTADDARDEDQKRRLKTKVAEAKQQYKWAVSIERKLTRKECLWEDLRGHERELVYNLRSDLLRDRLNEATAAHGHGTLRLTAKNCKSVLPRAAEPAS